MCPFLPWYSFRYDLGDLLAISKMLLAENPSMVHGCYPGTTHGILENIVAQLSNKISAWDKGSTRVVGQFEFSYVIACNFCDSF